MKKSDISNISNAESVERAEDSGQMNAQPSGQVSERFSKKANRLFGADPVGLDESARGIVVLVIVGVAVGLLSGMFGIGGGTVIVPALVWLGLTQRNAAATSMLAIVPTSISGVISYATCGNVDWLAALLLFCGMFVGGQIGSWLLSRLPELVLRWIFVVFLVFVVFNQISFVPSRDQHIAMSALTGVCLVLLGVVIGILAGLLGIGGGALAVPALSMLFGASDLIARGTSLLAMFPNSITTSVANLKRRLVHVKAALIIGCRYRAIWYVDSGRSLAPRRLDSVRLLPVRAAGAVHVCGRESHPLRSYRPSLRLTCRTSA